MVEVNQPEPVVGPGNKAVAAQTTKEIRIFVKDYKYDHWVLVAQRAQDLIVDRLRTLKDSNGQPVQAKVSCRAKEKDSLEEKLKMRNDKRIKEGKDEYDSQPSISADIHDLAGVRILLYTPNQDQHDKITEVIQDTWGAHVKPRLHPELKELSDGKEEISEEGIEKKYTPRHLGYRAVHYRAAMREEPLTQTIRGTYSWSEGDRVEVQVVSALGHAWAEAEHQFKYKSYAYGPPTVEEERLLDTLSGLVSSGELLLEQFSQLVNKRTYAKIAYRDDFGTFLRGLDVLKKPLDMRENGDEPTFASDFGTKGVDILFRFLVKQKQNYPLAVRDALMKLGYPDNSCSKLNDTLGSFNPPLQLPDRLRAPFCLIHTMHVECKPESKPYKETYQLSQQCRILMNALTLLQTFAGGPSRARDWLMANIVSRLDEPIKKSFNFILSSAKRWHCLTTTNVDLQKKLRPQVDPAWEWFQEQAANPVSVCGLLFQLAEMEATKDVDVNKLLQRLEIGFLD